MSVPKHLIYTGFYSRSKEEEGEMISNQNHLENDYHYWITNFKMLNFIYDTFLTLHTQRFISSSSTQTLIPLLHETLTFTSYDHENHQVGFLSVQNLYQDKGEHSISSPGQSLYSVIAAKGIFREITSVLILFRSDLSRNVYFYK